MTRLVFLEGLTPVPQECLWALFYHISSSLVASLFYTMNILPAQHPLAFNCQEIGPSFSPAAPLYDPPPPPYRP